MKTLQLIIVAIGLQGIMATAEEDVTVPIERYKSLPRFGIPDEFYTLHGFAPIVYLHQCVVQDPERTMSHSEKLSAALLIIAAEHATYEKYHQSYGVNMKCSLMSLLQKNFPGLGKVRASHDVNRNEIPIRDLGQFFREWIKNDLSEDQQAERIRAPYKEDSAGEMPHKVGHAGGGKPAEKPADRPPAKDQPSPPTSKDLPP